MTDTLHSSAAARGKSSRKDVRDSTDFDDELLSGEGELVDLLLAGGDTPPRVREASERREQPRRPATSTVAKAPPPKPVKSRPDAPPPPVSASTVEAEVLEPMDDVDPQLLSELDDGVRVLDAVERIPISRAADPLSAPPSLSRAITVIAPPRWQPMDATEWRYQVAGNRELAWHPDASEHDLAVIAIDLTVPTHLHAQVVAHVSTLLDTQQAALYRFYIDTPRHRRFTPLLDFIVPHRTRTHLGALRYFDEEGCEHVPWLLNQSVVHLERAWTALLYGPHTDHFTPTTLFLVDAAYTCE